MDIINQLAHKLEEVETIKNKLTPAYLEAATKTVLQGDIDEVDKVVKSHHEIFDQTNWASKPKVEIIGYENRKNLIGEVRDATLKLLNDQIAKLGDSPQINIQPATPEELTGILTELQTEKDKLTSDYLSKTDATTKEAKKTALKTLQGNYETKYLTVDTSKLTPEQKTKLQTEKELVSTLGTTIDTLFGTAPKGPETAPKETIPKEEGAQPSTSGDFTQAVQQIMSEFEKLKGDIRRLREEAVSKEVLANQKIQGLERKILERPIRETAPDDNRGTIPTSRDEGEFQDALDQPQAGTSENPQDKIVRQLRELKATTTRAGLAKESLTFKLLTNSSKSYLEKYRDKSIAASKAFDEKVLGLEKMELTTSQKEELNGYKEEKATLMNFISTTMADAIDAKKEGDITGAPTTVQAKPSTNYEGLVSFDDDDEPMVGSALDTVFELGDAVGKHGRDKTHHHHKHGSSGGSVSDPPPKPPRVLPKPDPVIVIDHDQPSNEPTGEGGHNALNIMPLKLETIQLPTFNGDLTEWIGFKDIFNTLIHQNPQLSDTIKFHQLKSKLRGPALDTIRGYQMIGINYAAAWEDLTRRYDRTDNLIQDYIRKFLEVPAIMHQANVPRLRAIVDATNQMIRALPSLGADVHHWDPFICLIVTTKLDEETRNEWKQHVGRRTNVTIGELIEFLETRAIDCQPSQGDRLSQMLRGNAVQRNPRRNIFTVNENQAGGSSNTPRGDNVQRQPRNIFQVTDRKQEAQKGKKKKCIVCQGDHYPWHCIKLKGECAKVRTEMMKSVGACFRCLLKHEIGECKKSDCPYCGGPHNILLCYKKENSENPRAGPSNQRRPQNFAAAEPSRTCRDEWEEWNPKQNQRPE